MAQLNFHCNYPVLHGGFENAISNATLTFVPISPSDSISWATANIIAGNGGTGTRSLSIGLYSLTGSTLSLANSISGSKDASFAVGYFSLTAISAAQNITPGNWWLGMMISTAGQSNFTIRGNNQINPANAFAGGFIQGRMTVSTSVLPSSYATSDLDTTGSDAFFTPIIILTA